MIADRGELDSVLATARHSLFRWEVRGIYQLTPVPLPYQQHSDLTVTPPVLTERVWVLCDPPTECQRVELQRAWLYRAAKENIRILQQHVAMNLGLPDHDYWLIDDEYVVRLAYGDRHELVGGEVLVTACEVAQHRTWRDLARLHAAPPNIVEAAL